MTAPNIELDPKIRELVAYIQKRLDECVRAWVSAPWPVSEYRIRECLCRDIGVH
jgi:hypothetical protein